MTAENFERAYEIKEQRRVLAVCLKQGLVVDGIYDKAFMILDKTVYDQINNDFKRHCREADGQLQKEFESL